MRILPLVAFFFLFSSSLLAQSTISGQVTDAATNSPLEGVQLELWNSAGDYIESATTDASGNYSLNTPGDGGI